MKRNVWIWIGLFVLAVLGSAFAYVWFSGGSGEPSTELTTPPIASASTSTSPEETSTSVAEETTTVPDLGEPFVIQADQSEATFTLDEVLRGDPNTVVGVTSEVAGQFVFDPSDPGSASFSPILINVRTFETGSGTRDRAIRGPIILNSASDDFELITFDVTTIEGLVGPVAVGETVEFALIGDLTIKGTTQEARFDVSATLVDEDIVQGIATSEVLRSDFEIGIPSVASVAEVTDEVALQLTFVASRT